MSRHIYQAGRRCLYHQGQALIDNFSEAEAVFTSHPYSTSPEQDEQQPELSELESNPFKDH